nr:hypothetical protein [Tanacetum cinerariifolium]
MLRFETARCYREIRDNHSLLWGVDIDYSYDLIRRCSLSSQILASPSKEKGNRNNLTVVLGTSGCRNVDVTLFKKR